MLTTFWGFDEVDGVRAPCFPLVYGGSNGLANQCCILPNVMPAAYVITGPDLWLELALVTHAPTIHVSSFPCRRIDPMSML